MPREASGSSTGLVGEAVRVGHDGLGLRLRDVRQRPYGKYGRVNLGVAAAFPLKRLGAGAVSFEVLEQGRRISALPGVVFHRRPAERKINSAVTPHRARRPMLGCRARGDER